MWSFSKTQENMETTSLPPGSLWSKRQIKLVWARMWRNWNTHTLLVGMSNGTASLETSLAIPQNVKGRITMWPCNFTPRCITKRNENIGLPKNLCISANSSVTHNSKKGETANVHQLMNGYTKRGTFRYWNIT